MLDGLRERARDGGADRRADGGADDRHDAADGGADAGADADGGHRAADAEPLEHVRPARCRSRASTALTLCPLATADLMPRPSVMAMLATAASSPAEPPNAEVAFCAPAWTAWVEPSRPWRPRRRAWPARRRRRRRRRDCQGNRGCRCRPVVPPGAAGAFEEVRDGALRQVERDLEQRLLQRPFERLERVGALLRAIGQVGEELLDGALEIAEDLREGLAELLVLDPREVGCAALRDERFVGADHRGHGFPERVLGAVDAFEVGVPELVDARDGARLRVGRRRRPRRLCRRGPGAACRCA